jgi:ketosteroid isomerase-like protein
MKRAFILPLLLALGCATQITSDIQPGDPEPAIRRMEREFAIAASSNNLADMMSVYDEGSVLLPPNASQISGKAGIQQYWGGLLAVGKAKLTLTPTKILSSCDQAAEVGTYDLTITPPNGGEIHDKGKYVVTWRRINGAWKNVIDIFNSDLPAQH